ncbi:MAG TPA: 50S ribosomal protein L29 [Nanoarchaeota archaeon]|nr:50S ribosomal protein L29 [Nanoarchaeota archaeon]
MSKKKSKAVRQMGNEQALEKLAELRKELLKANSQIAVGTVPESPGKVKQIKKEISRILTIISEPVQQKAAKAAVAPQGAAVQEKPKEAKRTK